MVDLKWLVSSENRSREPNLSNPENTDVSAECLKSQRSYGMPMFLSEIFLGNVYDSRKMCVCWRESKKYGVVWRSFILVTLIDIFLNCWRSNSHDSSKISITLPAYFQEKGLKHSNDSIHFHEMKISSKDELHE